MNRFLTGMCVGAVVGVAACRGPIPLFDDGFSTFGTISPEANEDVAWVLQKYGRGPAYRIDSTNIKRILFGDKATLFNFTDKELLARMGNPSSARAFRVWNPAREASLVALRFRARGYQVEELGELDPDVPESAMVFLRCSAFLGTVLVFRKHFFKMGPRPPKYVALAS